VKVLLSIDLDRTTPLEALELLYRWKSGAPYAPGTTRHRKATPRADSGPELF